MCLVCAKKKKRSADGMAMYLARAKQKWGQQAGTAMYLICIPYVHRETSCIIRS